MTIRNNYGLFSGRPALKSLVAYAIGIAIGGYVPDIPVILLGAAISLTIIAIILHFKSKPVFFSIFIYLALIICGAAQYKFATSGFPPTHIKKIAEAGNTVTITGDIVEEPDIRQDRTYLVVEVDSITWRKRDLKSSGKILVKIKHSSSAFAYNDRINFKGYLFAPGGPRNPGGFDFARYLSVKDIYGMVVISQGDDIRIADRGKISWRDFGKFRQLEEFIINRAVAPVRQTLLEGYNKYLPPYQASLLAGFVLGEKRGIAKEVNRLFTDTGTLHLMAVSGSNVAVVVAFFLAILWPVNRRLKIVIIIIAVIFFSFLTRNEPSVVRAAVMASVVLLGFYRRRNADTIGLLGFAGLILLIINPLWLFNVGFQLSFAACAGIVYLVPKFTDRVKRHRSMLSRALLWILFIFLTTIAAQMAVLPLTAEYFNRVPIIGILANLPMIILANILTIAGLCLLPFILLGDAIASLYAWPLSHIMSIILPLLKFFMNLPFAVINVGSPGFIKICLYFGILYVSGELIFNYRISFKGVVVALSASALLIWISYFRGPEYDTLTFIDCGPDRAVLFSDGNNTDYLWYDCNEHSQCFQLESSLIPCLLKLGVNQLDTVFANDREKIAKLAAELDIGYILTPDKPNGISYSVTKEGSPYIFTESILNKRVKLVCIQSDNISDTLTDRRFYELSVKGGDCILAGGMAPNYLSGINQSAQILELPWASQPYGRILDNLKEHPPILLVFSPDKVNSLGVNDRRKLTYLNDRIWATSFAGSFRFRFEKHRVFVDFMIKP